LKWK